MSGRVITTSEKNNNITVSKDDFEYLIKNNKSLKELQQINKELIQVNNELIQVNKDLIDRRKELTQVNKELIQVNKELIKTKEPETETEPESEEVECYKKVWNNIPSYDPEFYCNVCKQQLKNRSTWRAHNWSLVHERNVNRCAEVNSSVTI
jgi:hypothetical protein